MRICFVCLGNICRSPTAEGVMRGLVVRAGLADRITLDSAGTGAYHVGELPDPRTREAARRRGYELAHRAWQFTAKDLARFDLVLAMDRRNLQHVILLSGGQGVGVNPPSSTSRPQIKLFRSFDASSPDHAEVPDPWAGGDEGFEEVLDQCERACGGLLVHVQAHLGLAGRPYE